MKRTKYKNARDFFKPQHTNKEYSVSLITFIFPPVHATCLIKLCMVGLQRNNIVFLGGAILLSCSLFYTSGLDFSS